MTNNLTAFAGALALSLALTPLCRLYALKKGILDVPACEKHKGHQNATPLLGGLAMFLAWVIPVAAGLFFFRHSAAGPGCAPLRSVSGLAVVVLGAAASAAFGLMDDLHAMKAGKKLIFQLTVAILTVLFGGVKITLFMNIPVLPEAIAVFWIVLIMNAVNFFDNMDGLAAGTAAIAFTFFTLAAMVNHQYLVSALGAVSAGAAYGFWVYNKAPAKIFMGDSGSHFLGYLLAVVSARVTYFSEGVSTTRLTVLIPLFILAVPLLDTLTVVLIRLHNHAPIYVGDHNHISHRFNRMGLSRSHSVLLVHLLSLTAGLGALPLLWGEVRTCVLLLIQGLVIYTLIFFLQYALRRGEHEK